MPSTLEAVAALIVALLPGALYTWSFERLVGRWGVGLSDRLPRFVGVSALFHAACSPLTYWLWSEFWRTGRVPGGEPVPLLLWLVPVLYVLVPVAIGTAVGSETAKRPSGPRFSPVAIRRRERGTTCFRVIRMDGSAAG